ncbi:MAG: type 1 glutamine amidotransferase [Candidatus Omnitrophica bacterium]|nr:type 1 glutamine amidotransferase [Candidatus Omnitrophota bacterium]
MKIAVLVEDHYQVLEVWYPYLRLKEEGIETVFVGPGRKKEYGSKEGYPAPEETSVETASVDDFDGVIVPGGYAPDLLRRSKKIVDFVKNINKQKKLVAAICHAGWVLVSAGILKGKKATCFSAIKDDVVNAGAEFIDKAVVVDGNIVTSRTPYDLGPFCREIIKFLKSKGR